MNERSYSTNEILNTPFEKLIDADKNNWIGSVSSRIIVKNSTKYCSDLRIIPNISKNDYEKMAKGIVSFLRKIFPSMITNKDKNTVIMIEALNNNPPTEDSLNYGCKGLFYFSTLDENNNYFLFEYERFKNIFLPAIYHSKNPVSLYFGIFTMKYDISFGKKLIECKDGRTRNIDVPRILSNESAENKKPNSLFTECIFADIDNCDENKLNIYIKTFTDLNIPPSMIVFTGHGYQLYWVLNEKMKSVYNTTQCNMTEAKMEIFKNLLISKGFDIDKTVYNTTRLLRLPFSWNCKEFKKQLPSPTLIKTYIYDENDNIYDFSDIVKKLEVLPDKVKIEDSIYSNRISFNNNLDIDFLRKAYADTSLVKNNILDTLEEPIQKLLMGFQPGHTNGSCMVIPEYLRINYGLNNVQIIEIMLKLYDISSHITESRETIIKYSINNYYGYQTRYKNEFEQILGKLESNSKNKKSNVLRINNSIFDYRLSQNAFYVFMNMYIKISISTESIEEKYEFTVNELKELTGLALGTIRTALLELKRLGLVCYPSYSDISESNIFLQTREKEIQRNTDRTRGIGYSYTINQFNFKINPSNNYTDIHVQTINAMLKSIKYKEMKPRDMMIAIYLLMKCYNKSISCYPTQEEIADCLALSRPSVISSLKTLEKENFIIRIKNKNETNKFTFNYSYSLDLMKANI